MNTLPEPSATVSPHAVESPILIADFPFINTVELPITTESWQDGDGSQCVNIWSPSINGAFPFTTTFYTVALHVVGGKFPCPVVLAPSN